MVVERLRERFGRLQLGIGAVVVGVVWIEIGGRRTERFAVEKQMTGCFGIQLRLGNGTVVVARISGMTVGRPRC